MNIKAKRLFVSLLLSSLWTGAFAQIKDVSITVGANVPMYKDVESDIVLNLNYGQFYRSGFGFRAGVQWSPSVANVDNAFGVPISFAFRTKARSNVERLYNGALGASNVLDSYGLYGTDDNYMVRDVAGGFLLNLFRDMEFFAGVTPGYISGNSSPVSRASWGDSWQYWEDSWTEKKHSFSMTLDAGICLNYSVLRFDIKLMPAFHFDPIGNYAYHVSSGQKDIGTQSTSIQPLRWFFTFSGGLTFRF